jgi:predicted transcriptional regulator
MTRKSKVIKDDLLKKQQLIEETERLLQEAEKEEVTKLEKLKEGIDKMVDSEGLFCGVILTHNDLISVIQLALETKDKTISIPFRLYYKE